MSVLLRVSIVVAGLLLVGFTLRSIIVRDISERQSLFWLALGLALTVPGLFPVIPTFIARVFGVDYIPSIIFSLSIIAIMFGVFYCFRAIAKLQNRVQALAMQVSLLNQENQRLMGAQSPEGTGAP